LRFSVEVSVVGSIFGLLTTIARGCSAAPKVSATGRAAVFRDHPHSRDHRHFDLCLLLRFLLDRDERGQLGDMTPATQRYTEIAGVFDGVSEGGQ
jgi:hypothetical protein